MSSAILPHIVSSYASWSVPSRTKGILDQDSIIKSINGLIVNHPNVGFDRFRMGLSDIEITSIKASKTGRQIRAYVKFCSRTYSISICPYETVVLQTKREKSAPRTAGGLLHEFIVKLSKKFKIGKGDAGLNGKCSLVKGVKLNYCQSIGGKANSAGDYWFHAAMFLAICSYEPILKQFSGLAKEVNNFVINGGLSTVYDSHQRERAIESVKKAAIYCLQFDATLEEIEEAVKEAIVASTMGG